MSKSKFAGESFTLERLVPQQAKVTEFPGFVLIEEAFEEPFAMRTEDFARHMRLNKGAIDWVFDWPNIPCEERYFAVTDEYLEHYRSLPHLSPDYGLSARDLTETAEAGDFGSIVYDGSVMDGFIYDLNADPVYRSFHLRLTESDFYVKKVQSILLPDKRIRDLEVREIPYYNQDFPGEREVVFNYYPVDYDEFHAFWTLDGKDHMFAVEDKIREILKLGDLRKPAREG